MKNRSLTQGGMVLLTDDLGVSIAQGQHHLGCAGDVIGVLLYPSVSMVVWEAGGSFPSLNRFRVMFLGEKPCHLQLKLTAQVGPSLQDPITMVGEDLAAKGA